MTTPNNDAFDEGSNSVVIGIIKDLTKRLEAYEQASNTRLIEYEKRSSSERAALKRSIEANLVQVRKDWHDALWPLQLESRDHQKTHEIDREERIERQANNDKSMYLIRIVLLVMGGLLVGVLILLAIGIVVVIKAGR